MEGEGRFCYTKQCGQLEPQDQSYEVNHLFNNGRQLYTVTHCRQPGPSSSYIQTKCRAEQLKAFLNCKTVWTAGATKISHANYVTHCGQPESPSSYIQTKCRAEQLKAVLNCKTVWTAGATKSVMQTMSHTVDIRSQQTSPQHCTGQLMSAQTLHVMFCHDC